MQDSTICTLVSALKFCCSSFECALEPKSPMTDDYWQDIITTYGTTRCFLDLRVTKPCRTCSQGGSCSLQ